MRLTCLISNRDCLHESKGGGQYTLRQIPAALDEALRKKSRQDGKSTNQTVMEVLHTGLALNGDFNRHRDLDFTVRFWVEEPVFRRSCFAPRIVWIQNLFNLSSLRAFARSIKVGLDKTSEPRSG
jgi:hypothetical protein